VVLPTFTPSPRQQHRQRHLAAGIVLRDHDGKYTAAAFDRALEAGGAMVKVVGFRSPKQNAYVKRFAQEIEQERLDHRVWAGARGPTVSRLC